MTSPPARRDVRQLLGRHAAALRTALLVALAAGLAVSISLAEGAVIALAVVLLTRGERRFTFPLAGFVVAFATWTLVAAAASARPRESLADAHSVLWLGVMYVVLNAIDDARAVRRFATLLFALVAFTAVVAVLQVAFCPPVPAALPVLRKLLRKCDRAHAFYSTYMTLGGVLAMVLVAAVPRLAHRGLPLGWALPAWVVGVCALGLTYARGAWTGFAVGALATLAIARRRTVLAGALLAVLLAVAAVPTLRDRVVDRVRGIVTLEDNTLLDRLAMVTGALRIVRDHPWTGVGPGQVKHVYPVYAPPEALRRQTSHVHNTPLQILIERGVIGLALWLALFGAFFVRAGAIYRRLPAGEDRALVGGVLGAIAVFIVAGLFEYNFGDSEVLMVACALMALPFAVDKAGASEARRGRTVTPSGAPSPCGCARSSP